MRITITIMALALAGAVVPGQSKPNSDPDAARLITEDIPRFWRAFDQAGAEFSAEVFEREYLAKGSAGVKGFTRGRIRDAETLAAKVKSRQKFYAGIREGSLRVESMRSSIRASFFAMKYLYPEAVFPDVYFVVGALNSGGTTSRDGLLIGVEMNSVTSTTPLDELDPWEKSVVKGIEGLPRIVAHELVHFQQPPLASTSRTLLSDSVREGSADFIAELTAGGHINPHLHVYGNAREKELWEEFRQKMTGKDVSDWLYQGDKSKHRPADLGYYMGYKIAEAYYNSHADKRAAVRDILRVEDFEDFLKRSRYAEKFSTAGGK